jgi:hypothetical protein
MLGRRLTGAFISDIKLIAQMPWLLIAILFPLVIVILRFLACNYISGLNNAEKAMQYYTVIAVSLISAIPFIYGIVFSFIHLHSKLFGDSEYSVPLKSEKRELYLVRMVISGLWTFVAVLPVIYITDAVPTEGWLRRIYITLLLAAAAQFIFAFTAGSGERIMRWRVRSLISVMFLLPVPFGLILHHPWNYLAFFSPFYWINWAWIIPSPGESLIYGLISLLIVAAGLYLLYKKYVKGVMAE